MPRLLRSSSAYLSHTYHSLHRKKTAVVILPLGPLAHVAHPKPELWLPTLRFPSSPPNAEWANKPICMQAQAALDAIQSGTPLAGNLIVVRDANQATQTSTYYSTHALTECITLLLPGPAPKDAGFSQAFARGLGKGQISTQAIALRALGDWSKCPWPLPSTQVDTTKVPIVKRCTLRIVAPSEYRHLHLQKGQDNAQQVICDCDMAAWEPQIPASKLGGGQWTWQTSSKGPRSDNMLVGFLKLPF